jgi:hypothetical protein
MPAYRPGQDRFVRPAALKRWKVRGHAFLFRQRRRRFDGKLRLYSI